MKRDIPNIHEFAAMKGIPAARVMDFTTMSNPLGPPTPAKNAVRQGLRTLDRSPDEKATHLISAIARSEGVPREKVVVGSDAGTLVSTILRRRGISSVLCPAPYPAYYRSLADGAFDVRWMELDAADGFRLDAARFTEEMAASGAAILPNPFFLFREPQSTETILAIVTEASRHGTLLIIDETLRRYSPAPSMADKTSGDCLVLCSMTEYYAMAGLPVSYVIDAAGTNVSSGNGKFDDHPGSIATAAAAASLRDGAYQARTARFIAEERSFMEKRLGEIPGVAFFGACAGSFVITLDTVPARLRETFSRYNILIDDLGDPRMLFLPVKKHKWNARYIKTLKNIMGANKL